MTFTGLPVWMVGAMVAASAAALGLLHLLRVRPHEMRVVTTLFWEHAVEQTRARVLIEKFRHPMTYVLLLAICGLLALALGRPERGGDSADSACTVLVLDAGNSMQAPDGAGGQTRLDSARERALNLIRQMSSGRRLAVIAASSTPRVVQAFSDPRPAVEQSLRQLKSDTLPSNHRAALRLAAALLNGRGRPGIVLITDRRPEPELSALAGDVPTRIIRVGTPVASAAIVSASFQPLADDPLRGRFAFRVACSGSTSMNVNIRCRRAGGAPLLEKSESVAAGAVRNFEVPGLQADGDTLIVQADAGAGRACEGCMAFKLPLRTPIRVMAGTGAGAPLLVALQSDPAVRLVETAQNADVEVVVDPAAAPKRPAIIVRKSGAAITSRLPVVAAGQHSLLRSLAWEDTVCGVGPALQSDPGSIPLLVSGDTVLASLTGEGSSQRVELSAAVWTETATAGCAAFPALVSRCVRRLAGWDDLPVVLAPQRAADDPLWPRTTRLEGQVVVAPADREDANLAEPLPPDTGPDTSTRLGWFSAVPFEILLLLAAAGLLVDAFLHGRGRIP